MEITFEVNRSIPIREIIALYNDSGLNRPTADVERIEKMYMHSNLIISAWHGSELVGIARSLTDHCYCCYLSDLAVKKSYQKQGIGKTLIEKTRAIIGEETMLLLLSAPTAMDYYPKIGMENLVNAFAIKRSR